MGAGMICSLAAQNLVKNGDFNLYPKTLGPEFRTNGGAVMLFTEEYTWNRCGKLVIDKIRKSGKYDTFGSACWIGGSYADNKKPGGFKCKPNTTYDFSIDIKGTADSASFSITQWNSKQTLWHGKSGKTTVGSFKVQKNWINYKGSFTTGSDTGHVSLTLLLWGSSRYGKLKSKVGDYVLFDNVVIKERKRPALDAEGGAVKVKARELKIVSADGTVFKDFHVYKSNKPSSVATEFCIRMEKDAFVVSFVCHEPLKITRSPNANLWGGDVFEIFFGSEKKDRLFTQFVVGPDGRKFSGIGRPKALPWEVKVKVAPKKWSGTARIPFASISWSEVPKGTFIPFNAGRQRKAAGNELLCWGNVKEGFADLANSGRVYCAPYPKNMTRAAFEKSVAQKEAVALQAKMEAFRNSSFLAAPVHVTDDFSVPYVPDALFNFSGSIALRAAVNEKKPLPLALMNNTNKVCSYRVAVELPKAKAKNWHNGSLFPGVTYRQAVRVRDNEQGSSAIFDPLVELGPARIVTVGPKEAVLLWFDFDTTGLKPGVYNARVRIIATNGTGKFVKAGYGYGNLNFQGDMKDIPLNFTVLPIELSKEPAIPADFFSPPGNDSVIKLQMESGQRIFAINPWSLKFPVRNGKMIPEAPKAEKLIEFVKSRGCNRFFVGYSCKHVFLQQYGKKNLHLWPQWVKCVGLMLKKHNIPLEKSFMEIYDEPNPKIMPEILETLKIARKANLGLKITMTLGAHIMSPADLAKMAPMVDHWILWTHGYFSQAGHLAFIAKEKKRGVTFGHYTCATSIRSSLARNFRRNAWFGEYHKLHFNNMYQAISGLVNCTWKGNGGDALLYFAGDNDVAQPSVRYMAVRQGMTDVKYLQKLREVGKNSPAAQAFLKNASKRVVVDFAHDPLMPDKVREEAAALILKLQKK